MRSAGARWSGLGNEIEEKQMRDEEKIKEERAEKHRILHTLWTKAVGTPDYDKSEWRELEEILEK